MQVSLVHTAQDSLAGCCLFAERLLGDCGSLRYSIRARISAYLTSEGTATRSTLLARTAGDGLQLHVRRMQLHTANNLHLSMNVREMRDLRQQHASHLLHRRRRRMHVHCALDDVKPLGPNQRSIRWMRCESRQCGAGIRYDRSVA